jgi:hypothetical protein
MESMIGRRGKPNDILEHESFRVPTNRDVKIWRYMDLAKYVAILQQRALSFPRASTLLKNDPFEGSSTRLLVAARKYWIASDPAPAAYRDQTGDLRRDNERYLQADVEKISGFLLAHERT